MEMALRTWSSGRSSESSRWQRFRVYGLGFGGSLEFRVWGLGFRGEFRVQGLGFQENTGLFGRRSLEFRV